MAHWRIELRLQSALATPLHSGTLFGHLCWAYRDLHSEEALSSWLRRLPEEPLMISDAMPGGYLPKPLLPPIIRLHDPSLGKVLKKQRFLPLDVFLAHRKAMSESNLAAQASAQGGSKSNHAVAAIDFKHRTAHNRIDRHTGTTPESGGLYFVDEFWPQAAITQAPITHSPPSPAMTGNHWDVYVSSSLADGELQGLFAHVGNSGFGKDAALGRGRFHSSVHPAPPGLFDESGSRWMTLSHGSLTPNMTDARYRLRTHYGKLGPALANHRSPFKYPLTLLEPGSTFASSGTGPFGELLSRIHPDEDLRDIVHNAWHLAVAYTEAPHA
jgi:CRISPR-associated protein Csm4